MPELPEVEIVKLQLQNYLIGHTILSVTVNTLNIFEGDTTKIIGATFIDIRRFGKALVMDLDSGYSLVAHIKLTGQFIYRGKNLISPPTLSKKVTGGIGGVHTHVIFELDDDSTLYYNDVRRFGWIKVFETKTVLEKNDFLAKLGQEFLSTLTFDEFFNQLQKTRRAVKVVIMDQSKMAGLGNIYASDALWDAYIDPKRPANSLTKEEAHALFDSSEKVLKKGIETGGASELAFVTPDGSEGSYQKHTLIYGKENTKCIRCHTVIRKYMLGGRGTYQCENCQK